MALDFNKPPQADAADNISRVNMRFPRKKTMNLLAPEQVQTDYRSALVAGIVLAVLVFAFAKFAVFDRYAAVTEKQQQLDAVRTELTQVEKQLDGFEALEQEYQAYTGISPNANGVPDALTIARMVNDVLGSDSKMTSLTMSGTQLRVKLDGYSLKQIGELTEKFKKQDAVKKITVSTANTDSSDEEGVSATLTISLVEDNAPANGSGAANGAKGQ